MRQGNNFQTTWCFFKKALLELKTSGQFQYFMAVLNFNFLE